MKQNNETKTNEIKTNTIKPICISYDKQYIHIRINKILNI